jgi:CBS domain-containing protein
LIREQLSAIVEAASREVWSALPSPVGLGSTVDRWELPWPQPSPTPDASYAARVHAEQMAEDYPVLTMESDALEAAELLAEHRLPGLVVTDQGRPRSVLPASQVVRFLVPGYVQDDPTLARVLDESMADQVAKSLGGKSVGDLITKETPELAVVNADDTIIEVAAIMARLRCPLAAVMRDDQLIGVVTASRLLQAALAAE